MNELIYEPMLLDFGEVQGQSEDESDVNGDSASDFSDVAITGTDWTTETIVNQINKGNILLNPRFQRRDAWTKSRKSSFIESLILGMPVPQIVLAQLQGSPGQYIVLDGKQRLLALRQFCASDSDKTFQKLNLSGLNIRKELNGLSYSDMLGCLERKNDLAAFENQSIRTVLIKNWTKESYLYHVFLRLNTGSVSLSPQELRQALHPGPFVDFIENASRDSSAIRDMLGISEPDFRMRDAELLLRYFAFSFYIQDYTGNLKEFLDLTCKKLNTSWPDCEEAINLKFAQFEEAHWAIRRTFKINAYRKWTGVKYENKFNRAIFDIMMATFREDAVRNLAIGKEDAIIEAFKSLCSDNQPFRSSLEQTTKSLPATRIRLTAWNDALEKVLGIGIPSIDL